MRHAAWLRLLQAHPPSWVCDHCRAVEALATAMVDAAEARALQVDRDRVQAGALLHDIGRSVTQDVRHATLGAQMLRKDLWDEAVVRIVERHTGAGIDAAEAMALGLPNQDFTPHTIEEKIVAHADNLYSGDKRLSLAQLEAKYQAKALPKAWNKIRLLHVELTQTLGVDLERLKPAELPPP